MKLGRLLRLFFTHIGLFMAQAVYGGQAVVSGVMMKGPNHYAVSVRISKGIVTKVTAHTSITQKHRILNIPFLRGVFVLFDMMIIGYKSLYYSADVALEDEEGEDVTDTSLSKGLSTTALVGTMIISLGLAIFLFKFLPLGAARLIDNWLNVPGIVFNLIDGLVKASIFVAYLYVLGRTKDMKELFQYHGAEHKSINCYEQGKSLTLKNIIPQDTVHKRCGTTFMFVVLFISVLVYLFIPKDLPFLINLTLRIALLPIIAGISYELQRYAALHSNRFLDVLISPGLLLQALTVNKPNAKQIKTGSAALKAVLSAEK